MRKLNIFNYLLLTSVLVIFATTTACSQNAQPYSTFAISKLDTAKVADLNLLDVRTPQEYQAGHLEGAKLVNIFDSNFSDRVQQIFPNKTDTIRVYCRTSNRSRTAANELHKAGYKNVIQLTGGFNQWSQVHGNKAVKQDS